VRKEDRAAGADEAAVLRAVAGRENMRLRPVELREAILYLVSRGWSGRQIAKHLGCCNETVYRHRKAFEREGNRA